MSRHTVILDIFVPHQRADFHCKEQVLMHCGQVTAEKQRFALGEFLQNSVLR